MRNKCVGVGESLPSCLMQITVIVTMKVHHTHFLAQSVGFFASPFTSFLSSIPFKESFYGLPKQQHRIKAKPYDSF